MAGGLERARLARSSDRERFPVRLDDSLARCVCPTRFLFQLDHRSEKERTNDSGHSVTHRRYSGASFAPVTVPGLTTTILARPRWSRFTQQTGEQSITKQRERCNEHRTNLHRRWFRKGSEKIIQPAEETGSPPVPAITHPISRIERPSPARA